MTLDVVRFIMEWPAGNAAPEIMTCCRNLAAALQREMEAVYIQPLYRTDYSVTGHGPFPTDMLRYAQSWPATESDARAIDDSHEHTDYTDAFTVRLSKYHRDERPSLSEDRWASKFRWRLVGVIETTEL